MNLKKHVLLTFNVIMVNIVIIINQVIIHINVLKWFKKKKYVIVIMNVENLRNVVKKKEVMKVQVENVKNLEV